ncbi:hypothetical protein EXU85_20270 [Spirosoma sp. KCTC 42546]|uniref:helix-turn-helix domain-containing protein n=1 Tax=Spirosoma sp. KCTC 42546 TaxID=2520506 RepID=UPI001156D16D|nr:helix-turn-helix domain-containing protein [Spirosoma sp. KCTC 42546]QDK80815.1 hypothetical protein EXU85_20270 [Spirosoma sp. KCTC 42546]
MANQCTKANVSNDSIINAYLAGGTIKSVAALFKMSSGIVNRIVNEVGITRQKYNKKKAILTPEIKQQIVAAYLDGNSSLEISKAFDVCTGTVTNIMNEAGYVVTRKHLTDEQKKYILDAYVDGKNSYEIGREIGFSNVIVSKLIRESGIEKRSLYRLSEEQQAQVAIDYENGESSEQIAKRLGVSANTVRDAIRKNGVEIRQVWPKKEVPAGQLFNPNYDPQDLPECSFAGIYKFTNKINGKIYVGQAQDIYQRYYRHRESRNKGLFPNALKKYGIGNFHLEVLERVEDLSRLDEREQYWMDFYQCYDPKKGYNIAKVASSCRGVKRSAEQVEVMRAKLKHFYAHNENPNRGRRASDATRRKISESHIGKTLSPEHRAKLGRPITPERRMALNKGINEKWRKKIAQIDPLSSEVIKVWERIEDIKEELGICIGSVQCACRGKAYDSAIKDYRPKTTHAGFKWQYVD